MRLLLISLAAALAVAATAAAAAPDPRVLQVDVRRPAAALAPGVPQTWRIRVRNAGERDMARVRVRVTWSRGLRRVAGGRPVPGRVRTADLDFGTVAAGGRRTKRMRFALRRSGRDARVRAVVRRGEEVPEPQAR